VYDFTALRQLWQSVGGPTTTVQTDAAGPQPLDKVMAAIALAESAGVPTAQNSSGASGLWQILGFPTGFPSTANVFDPTVNAQMALAKYQDSLAADPAGLGLAPWTTYTGADGGRVINGIYYPFTWAAFLPAGDPVASFPAPPPLTPTVIDQGVDFAGSGPLYAVGAGTITNLTSTGWPGGAFILLHLDDSSGLPSSYVYYAEDITPSVTIGQTVTANEQIGTATGGPDGIEIGFADTRGAPFDQSLAAQLGLVNDPNGIIHTAVPPSGVAATNQGQPAGNPASPVFPGAQFWNWIHQLGPYAGGAGSTQPGPGQAPGGSTVPPAGTTPIRYPTSILVCQPYTLPTYYTPTQQSGRTFNAFPFDTTTALQPGVDVPLLPIPNIAAFTSGNRVAVIQPAVYPVGAAASLIMQGDDLIAYSDPPAMATPPPSMTAAYRYEAVYNYYTLENASGFGAWGSVSTGELVMIRRGQGAVMVAGDPAFPTFVTKLPAVHGTGQIMQRMTQCQTGSLYVTQTDGVYAWNGGNTSTKISPQIPDQAIIRPELEPGGLFSSGVVGVRTWHDVLNNLVFFPNNWVFDSTSNSWWQCEDPDVFTSGGWAASGAGVRFMYGVAATPVNNTYPVYQFDATTLTSSYLWESNPLLSATETLVTIIRVEIVASNPTTTDCTVTITPTIPPGNVSRFANNPQSVTFNIPPQTAGYRAFLPLGFTEYNICLRVEASNTNPDFQAPAIHQINADLIEAQTTGIT